MSIPSMSFRNYKEGLQNKVGGAMVPWTTTPTHYQNITKLNMVVTGKVSLLLALECNNVY